jgi:hypothetical protein
MRFLDKHTTRDKNLLRLEREYNQLCRALRDAPVIPLAEPYQRGWSKTYVLRKDIGRRPDASVFLTVLSVINRRVWSKTRDFAHPDGQPMVLRPRIVPLLEWHRLRWPASHRRLFAYGHWEDEVYPCTWFRRRLRSRRLYIGFSIRNPWWMEEEVQPWMITHQRIDLPDVRRRMAEIEAHMGSRCGWERLGHLHGRSNWWRRFETHRSERRADAALHDHVE